MKTMKFTSSAVGSALGVALVLTASAGVADDTGGASMIGDYKDYKAAWNRHDVPALMVYFGEHGTLDNPNAGGPVSGEALGGWLQATFSAIPDFQVRSVSADTVDADTLVDRWVITGTWTQPFPGGPLAGAQPTGKSFSVPGASFYDWKDSKIVAGTQYFNQMELLTEMGVIPPPGENPQASAK